MLSRTRLLLVSAGLVLVWLSASLQAQPQLRTKPFRTTFSGVVLDAATDAPLQGVLLRMESTGVEVRTDAGGNFRFLAPPTGEQWVFVDGSTAQSAAKYPSLPMPYIIEPDGNNRLPLPIWLPQIDETGGVTLIDDPLDPGYNFDTTIAGDDFDGVVVSDIVVANPNIPGTGDPTVTLTIPAGTHMKGLWTKVEGGSVISITSVPPSKPPMALPAGLSPSLLLSLQPGGTMLLDANADFIKVPIKFPNLEGYADGSEIRLIGVDETTGFFYDAGPMTVVGNEIVATPPLSGIKNFSWHLPPPPKPILETEEQQDTRDPNPCEEVGSWTDYLYGELEVRHDLVTYRSMGQTRGLSLSYSAQSALEQEVVWVNSSFAPGSPAPSTLSVNGSILGGIGGTEVHWAGSTQRSRHAFLLSTAGLPTGRYTYQLEGRSNFVGPFFTAFASTTTTGELVVVNDSASPFGVGWTLSGLEKIEPIQPGSPLAEADEATGVLLTSRGGARFFRTDPRDSILDLAILGPSGIDLARGGRENLFQVSNTLSPGSQTNVVTGDFDGDGFDDIATGTGNQIVIQTNLGGGLWSSTTEDVSGTVLRIDAGDVDDDDICDLVATLRTQAGLVLLTLLNRGDGSFEPHEQAIDCLTSSLPTVTPIIARLNGDRYLDVLITPGGNSPDSCLAVMLSEGDGTYREERTDVLPNPEVSVVADLNDDGFQDIAVGHTQGYGIELFWGAGDGTYDLENTLVPGLSHVRDMVSGDFDGNGYPDLFVFAGGFLNSGFSVYLNRGDWSFDLVQDQEIEGFFAGKALIAEDFDGDEALDVAYGDAATSELKVLLGTGNGTLIEELSLPLTIGPAVDLALGDLIGGLTTAGSNDVQFIEPRGNFSVLTQRADGTFSRRLKSGTEILFDDQGRQSSVVDRTGNTTTYQYNPDGTLASIADPTGFTHTFSYSSGQLTSITDSANRTTTFTIDGNGDLVEIIDPDGAKRTFTYDSPDVAGPDHLLTSQTSPRAYDPGESRPASDFVTQYQYNFAGQLEATQHPGSSRVWGLAPIQSLGLVNPASGQGTPFNPAPALLASNARAAFVNPGSGTSEYLTDGFGLVTSVRDPLNRTTTLKRDGNGQPTEVTDAGGVVTRMAYDGMGNLTSIIEASGTALQRSTSLQYEPDFNQITRIVAPKGDVTLFEHDASGNLTRIIDDDGVATRMEYTDPQCPDQVTRIVAADGLPEQSTTQFTYDPASLCNLKTVTNPLGHVTTFEYDAAGNVTKITDAELHVTEFAYDVMNRLTLIRNHLLQETKFEYDAAGNQLVVEDAKLNRTRYVYDARDRVEQRIDPLGNADFYAYDPSDNLVSTTDRNGDTITYVYDAADQLERKIWYPSLPNERITTYTYDDRGNLTAVVDPDSALAFAYDHLNQLTRADTTGSPHQPAVVIDFEYDANGNRIKMTDSDAAPNATDYVIDNLNRVTSITSPSGLTVGFEYDALGRRTRTNYPGGVVTSEISYDAASQITQVKNAAGAQIISQFDYSVYDKVGNRKQVDVTRPGLTVTPTITYDYDATYQLIRATHPLPGQPDETFTYDAVGNRLRRDGQSVDATFDAANRLLTDQDHTYQYDLNGNLTQKTQTTTGDVTDYTFNIENQLVLVEQRPAGGPVTVSVVYKYDGLGRRVSQDLGTTGIRYVYDEGDNVVCRYDWGHSKIDRAQHGPDVDDPVFAELLGAVNPILSDALGSIVDYVNSSGVVSRSIAYQSFGTIAADSGASIGAYGYTARDWDAEAKLSYYRARFYDGESGRFLSEDPIGFSSGQFNLYSYVGNNPINWTDPDGLERKRGKTPPGKLSPDRPKGWPNLPPQAGKKPKWNSKGYYDGKNGTRWHWDDQAHGSGVDRGDGPQGGHWDEEKTGNRYAPDGRQLPRIMEGPGCGPRGPELKYLPRTEPWWYLPLLIPLLLTGAAA